MELEKLSTESGSCENVDILLCQWNSVFCEAIKMSLTRLQHKYQGNDVGTVFQVNPHGKSDDAVTFTEYNAKGQGLDTFSTMRNKTIFQEFGQVFWHKKIDKKSFWQIFLNELERNT